MRIFLTGGTGFIGQRLVAALRRRGHEVDALVRRPEAGPARALEVVGAWLVSGDVTDRESMRAGMTGAEAVFHNAGWYELGVTANVRQAMHAINVDGTENTLGLAAELGIPRVYYTSSILAWGDTGDTFADESFTRRRPPVTVYEATKTEAHDVALRFRRQGLPLVIVCPGAVIGPADHSAWGQNARQWVRRRLPPILWAAERHHSCVYVDDLAEGMALAVEGGRMGEDYILTGPPRRMREIVELWARTPGGLRPRIWLPYPLAYGVGAMGEVLLRLLGQQPFVSREVVKATSIDMRFSAAKAERELGVRFRSPEEAWQLTLEAERRAAGRV